MNGLTGTVLAAGAMLLCAAASGSPLRLPETGTGTKQGPLLMIDEIRRACEDFLGEGLAASERSGAAEIADRLALVPGPDESFWQLPSPPEVGQGAFTFLPPHSNGCCTTEGGTGKASVSREDNRGAFEASLSADGGKYGYIVASPCLDFDAPVDGYALCRMALVLRADLEFASEDGGEAMVAFGPWIAHCHPKDQGAYSLGDGGMLNGAGGRVSVDRQVLVHQARLPVRRGVHYKFGVGLWAACAATGDSAVAARFTGRVAYLTVEFEPAR